MWKRFRRVEEQINFYNCMVLREGNEGYVVYYDATRVGLGCLFTHHGKVMAYGSTLLQPRVKNFLTHDLELATFAFAVKIWRHCL